LIEFDGVQISIKSEKSGEVKVDLKCLGGAAIRENGADETMARLYEGEYSSEGDGDCRLSFDMSSLPETQKPKKDSTDEEREAIHTANREAKEKRAEAATHISERWSYIKRDFIGAPILRALEALKDGSCSSDLNCDIPYRAKEWYWVRSTADKVTVIFSVHFDNKVDESLAKIMLYEMAECKIVKQAASINYHRDATKLPPGQLSELNVDPTKANCGLISFTLIKTHLNKGVEVPLYFL
jgi:hypothetical protein